MSHPTVVLYLLLFISTIIATSAQRICPNAIKTDIKLFRGSPHIICITGSKLDIINRGDTIVSQNVEPGTNDLASFVDDDGTLRILLAAPDRINGTSLISVDKDGKVMPEIHTVSSQFVNQLSIWRLELNLEWQLAIANQPAYEPVIVTGALSNSRQPLPEPGPMISLYSWRSTYFDRYQLIHLPQDGRVNKIQPMNINGQEFLIIAMDSTKSDQHNDLATNPTLIADTLIYKLEFGDGNLDWVEYSRIPTRLALDARAFSLTHRASLQQDYYIALLGKMKVSNDYHATGARANMTDEDSGLIIFKYFGDRFEKTHMFPSGTMTKLEAITYGDGDTNVLIALLSGWTKQVTLLLFDGLDFKVITSPSVSNPTNANPYRQRRVMNNVNLQLYLDNSLSSDSPEVNQSSKRTLESGPQSFPSPVLTISDPEGNYDFDTTSAGSSSGSNVYKIPASEIIPADSYDRSSEDPSHKKRDFTGPNENLLSWCKSTLSSIVSDNFESLAKELTVLPRIDQHQPIELNGDLIIEDDLHIKNLLYVNRVEEIIGQQQVIIENTPSNFSGTFNEIQQVHSEIDKVKHQVDEILVDDGSEQNFFNEIHFDTLIVECPHPNFFDPRLQHLPFNRMSCPHVDDLRTTFLNKQNISRIAKQALLTGRSMVVEQDVRFEHLVLKGITNISGTLNGIQISDIVFKKGFVPGPITGWKDFKNGLYSQSDLHVGSWKGTQVDRNNYFTSSGDQTIPSMRFIQVVIDSQNNSSHIANLNGLDLSRHFSQIALSDSENHFEIPIQFDELILNGPIQMVGGLSRLSSIDLEDLWIHTMFKHSTQNVTAPMDFSGSVHISYGGNMFVNGSINGFLLRPGEIMMRNLNYSIPNPVHFDSDIRIKDLHLLKSLNGIQVMLNTESGNYELAILYNRGNQEISGDKLLNQIHLGGQSTIFGHINGHLNLSQLHSLANSFNQTHRFETIRLAGTNIKIGDRAHIHILSTVNGIPANRICSLALEVDGRTHSYYRRLRLGYQAKFRSLNCASVNGFSRLDNTFLTKFGNQHVAGSLRLASGVIFNTSLTIGSTLNGLQVRSLSRALSSAKNESITGHRDVYGDLDLEELIANRINDMNLADVFLARSDSPQIVRAQMIFDHLDIESILKTSNIQTSSFNGLNITDILQNTLQYDAPQIIYNTIHVDSLKVLAGSNLNVSLVNGVNLRRVFSDAVMYDTAQQIIGPKTFTAPIEFTHRLSLSREMDGLTFEELKSHLLLNTGAFIEGDLVLNRDVNVKSLEIESNSINDMDVRKFVQDMVHTTGPIRTGNGSVRFKDVQVNDLVVGGRIQGINVAKEALLRGQEAMHAPLPGFNQQVNSLTGGISPAGVCLSGYCSSSPHPKWEPRIMAYSSPPTAPYLPPLPVQPLRNLPFVVNSHLSASLYYDISHKHPLLGPLLLATDNVEDTLLLLRGTGNPGEPCLRRDQSIAVMSQRRSGLFTQISRIQETSDPSMLSSINAGNVSFLFVSDALEGVLVFTWDFRSGMYELRDRIKPDGPVVAMKALLFRGRGCVALASLSASPAILCPALANSSFTKQFVLPISNILDMDLVQLPGTDDTLIATLSQHMTEQIGDLTLFLLIGRTKTVRTITSRKMIKPIKLHFFKDGINLSEIYLALSESSTSNSNTQASTQIFKVMIGNLIDLQHVQKVLDNEFYDIQSVSYGPSRSLIFLQSTHSISIYANCGTQYSLIQRVPTRGASKFLVFNDRSRLEPSGHFIVLSSDQCEDKHQYATVILKAKLN